MDKNIRYRANFSGKNDFYDPSSTQILSDKIKFSGCPIKNTLPIFDSSRLINRFIENSTLKQNDTKKNEDPTQNAKPQNLNQNIEIKQSWRFLKKVDNPEKVKEHPSKNLSSNRIIERVEQSDKPSTSAERVARIKERFRDKIAQYPYTNMKQLDKKQKSMAQKCDYSNNNSNNYGFSTPIKTQFKNIYENQELEIDDRPNYSKFDPQISVSSNLYQKHPDKNHDNQILNMKTCKINSQIGSNSKTGHVGNSQEETQSKEDLKNANQSSSEINHFGTKTSQNLKNNKQNNQSNAIQNIKSTINEIEELAMKTFDKKKQSIANRTQLSQNKSSCYSDQQISKILEKKEAEKSQNNGLENDQIKIKRTNLKQKIYSNLLLNQVDLNQSIKDVTPERPKEALKKSFNSSFVKIQQNHEVYSQKNVDWVKYEKPTTAPYLPIFNSDVKFKTQRLYSDNNLKSFSPEFKREESIKKLQTLCFKESFENTSFFLMNRYNDTNKKMDNPISRTSLSIDSFQTDNPKNLNFVSTKKIRNEQNSINYQNNSKCDKRMSNLSSNNERRNRDLPASQNSLMNDCSRISYQQNYTTNNFNFSIVNLQNKLLNVYSVETDQLKERKNLAFNKFQEFSACLLEMQRDYNSKLSISIRYFEKFGQGLNKMFSVDSIEYIEYRKLGDFLKNQMKKYTILLNKNSTMEEKLSLLLQKASKIHHEICSKKDENTSIKIKAFEDFMNDFSDKCVFQYLEDRIKVDYNFDRIEGILSGKSIVKEFDKSFGKQTPKKVHEIDIPSSNTKGYKRKTVFTDFGQLIDNLDLKYNGTARNESTMGKGDQSMSKTQKFSIEPSGAKTKNQRNQNPLQSFNPLKSDRPKVFKHQLALNELIFNLKAK